MPRASVQYNPSPYDSFAWFYDRYWAVPFQKWQAPALDKLLFSELKPGARILDLCCGTGQLSEELAARGFDVVGIDSSEEMLCFARRKVPCGEFLCGDAADFTLERPADAAVCTFDSLNHLVLPGAVALAFQSVHAALKRGGCFVFDVNTPNAYGRHWDQSACQVADDHAFFLRGGFDAETRTGTTMITMFRLFDTWQRSDVELQQRPLEIGEVESLLRAAGFAGISSYRAPEDLGMNDHYGEGRVYFRACTSLKEPDEL
jgi:SAM-dependent methyltransferase